MQHGHRPAAPSLSPRGRRVWRGAGSACLALSKNDQNRSLQTKSLPPVVVGETQLPPWSAPASPHQPSSGLSGTHRAGTPSPEPPFAGIGLNSHKKLPTAPSSCTVCISIPQSLPQARHAPRSCTNPKHVPISHGPKARSSLGRERRSPAAGSYPRTVSEGPCSANGHSRGRWGHGRSPLPVPRHPQRLAMNSCGAAAPSPLSGSGGPACARQKLD